MLVIPAIDIWEGKVIRLRRGNPSLSTVYSENPLEVAKQWEEEGAEFLHLVDLSSALGEKDNLKIIEKILKEVKIKVEVGGGIRDLTKAEKIISLGAERVIIGTKSIEEGFLNKIIDYLGKEKLAVSVDVLNSFIAVKGWQEKTSLNGLDFINYLKDKGIKWIIYTDISRDGTLKGINLKEIKKLSSLKEVNIIFSGGISNLDDFRKIKETAPFLWGIIVGKALYEHKINFNEAMRLCYQG